jgi:hypothetical protein
MSVVLLNFVALVTCRTHPPLDFFSLVPGNWTQVVNNVSSSYPITLVSTEIAEDGLNTTTYEGNYKETPIQINVTSNMTAQVGFGEYLFKVEAIQERGIIARSDCILHDGTHVVLTFYASISLEISIIPKGSSEIFTYGFFKKPVNTSTWFDFVLPVLIALILTFAVHKFLPQVFG